MDKRLARFAALRDAVGPFRPQDVDGFIALSPLWPVELVPLTGRSQNSIQHIRAKMRAHGVTLTFDLTRQKRIYSKTRKPRIWISPLPPGM